jgi:hypothetical protein
MATARKGDEDGDVKSKDDEGKRKTNEDATK